MGSKCQNLPPKMVTVSRRLSPRRAGVIISICIVTVFLGLVSTVVAQEASGTSKVPAVEMVEPLPPAMWSSSSEEILSVPTAATIVSPPTVVEYYEPSLRYLEEEDGYVSPSIPEEDIHPFRVPTRMPSLPVGAGKSLPGGQIVSAAGRPGINEGKISTENASDTNTLTAAALVVFPVLLTVVGYFAVRLYRRYGAKLIHSLCLWSVLAIL
jgi:hypothetical protein